MNTNQNEQELMNKAKERVGQRVGLIIHIICWLVISVVIIIVVPEGIEAMGGVRPGFLVLGFWGICVAIHAIVYALSSRKITRNYDSAVQREYEKMKSEESKK